MQIIAHRGASGDAPENTLAAFSLAWESKADGIEVDVRLSRDQRIMAHHDADTMRTAGIRHCIADTDSATLRKLDVGAWKHAKYRGQTMPFLEEVLALTPADKRILIEIKCGSEIAGFMHKILSETPYKDLKIGLISFNIKALQACRQLMPDLSYYPITAAIKNENGHFMPHSPELIAFAQRHAYPGLDPQQEGISAEFAAAARQANLELLTWTVNDKARCRELLQWQIDAITTDWPAAMLQLVQAEEPGA